MNDQNLMGLVFSRSEEAPDEPTNRSTEQPFVSHQIKLTGSIAGESQASPDLGYSLTPDSNAFVGLKKVVLVKIASTKC